MFGKPRDFSIVSHYAGDLRSIYYPFLDTFFLKSLNAIDHISYEENSFVISGINEVNEIDNKNYGKLYLTYNNNKLYENDEINYYDEIILCTGWKFNKDIFGFNVNYTINDKYPEIKPNFESGQFFAQASFSLEIYLAVSLSVQYIFSKHVFAKG